MIDHADWRGIRIVSRDMGASVRRRRRFKFGGIQYVTLTERIIAELLTAMDIAFTPNVEICLDRESGKIPMIYVPDFIFDGEALIWCDEDGEKLVHGIECKGMTRHVYEQPHSSRKVRRLARERDIVLKMICEEEALEFQEVGRLPLRPFTDQ
jgi:hypothetical protein